MTARRWHKGLSGVVEPVAGNQLRLLQSGAEFFPALIAAIDAAQSEVHLETYIFNTDSSAEAVRDALIRAAQRQVQVRVLVDGVGSHLFPAGWRKAFEVSGVSLLVYRPLVMAGRPTHAVCDACIANWR